MSLTSALDHLFKASRISGNKNSYRKDNPTEYSKVDAYIKGGSRPSGVSTEMGMGLMEIEDERRANIPPPLPPNVALSAATGVVT